MQELIPTQESKKPRLVRAIWFKAKRKKDGDWVTGSLDVAFDQSTFITYWENVLIEPDNDYHEPKQFCDEVHSDTVCQYIGVTIHDFVRIFEGDILIGNFAVALPEKKHGKFQVKPMDMKLTVEWDQENLRFSLNREKGFEKHRFIPSFGRCQVIGNIHDDKY